MACLEGDCMTLDVMLTDRGLEIDFYSALPVTIHCIYLRVAPEGSLMQRGKYQGKQAVLSFPDKHGDVCAQYVFAASPILRQLADGTYEMRFTASRLGVLVQGTFCIEGGVVTTISVEKNTLGTLCNVGEVAVSI